MISGSFTETLFANIVAAHVVEGQHFGHYIQVLGSTSKPLRVVDPRLIEEMPQVVVERHMSGRLELVVRVIIISLLRVETEVPDELVRFLPVHPVQLDERLLLDLLREEVLVNGRASLEEVRLWNVHAPLELEVLSCREPPSVVEVARWNQVVRRDVVLLGVARRRHQVVIPDEVLVVPDQVVVPDEVLIVPVQIEVLLLLELGLEEVLPLRLERHEAFLLGDRRHEVEGGHLLRLGGSEVHLGLVDHRCELGLVPDRLQRLLCGDEVLRGDDFRLGFEELCVSSG